MSNTPSSCFGIRKGFGFILLVVILAFATLLFPLILKYGWLNALEPSEHNANEAVVGGRNE